MSLRQRRRKQTTDRFGISYVGSTFHAGPIAEKIGLAFKASGGEATRSIVTL